MFKIENEFDLHTKVLEYNSRFYPECILVATLGENQDTSCKINSWKRGFTNGSPNLLLLNIHKDFAGCCIEFKSLTNNYQVSEAQKQMKKRYKENNYYFVLSNDYDQIIQCVNKYMKGIRVPCKYCSCIFLSKETTACLNKGTVPRLGKIHINSSAKLVFSRICDPVIL